MKEKCTICGKEVKEGFIKQHQAGSTACKALAANANIPPEVTEVQEVQAGKPVEVQTEKSEKLESPAKMYGVDSWTAGKWETNTIVDNDLLSLELKDPRMYVRWANPKKFETWKHRGLITVKYKDVKNLSSLTLADGKTLDSVVKVREMVAVMCPKTFRDARRKKIYSRITQPEDIKREYAKNFLNNQAKIIEEAEAAAMPLYQPDQTSVPQ